VYMLQSVSAWYSPYSRLYRRVF